MLPDRIHHGKQNQYSGKIYPSSDFTVGRKPNPRQDKTPAPTPASPDINMGLSVVSNLRKSVKRGQKGITSQNKRLLKSAATILSKKYSKEQLSFLTVTTPAITPDENILLNSRWGHFKNRVMEEITRELSRHGINAEIVDCTEIQPKRYQTSGIVGLHLHILVRGRKTRYHPWAISKGKIDTIVKNQFENIFNREVDCRACCNIEPIKKDVTRYLSKYMSKGGAIIKKIIADGKDYLLPSSWCGLNRNLRQSVIASIVKLTGNKVLTLIDAIESGIPGIVAYPIILEQYDNLVVGYVGYFTDPNLQAYFS